MLRTTLLSATAAALLTAPAALAQTAPDTAPQTAPAAPAAQTPAASEDVIEMLKMHGRFTTLLQAFDQAQLTETLATRDRITIFAPTDEVFAALPEAERTRLLDPANAQELRNLMLYHVLVADLRPDQIVGARGPIATAGGLEVNIDGTGEAITIGGATVTDPAIDAGNGGIYVIDRLLDPNAAAQGDAEEAGDATPPPSAAVRDEGPAAGAPSTPTPNTPGN